MRVFSWLFGKTAAAIPETDNANGVGSLSPEQVNLGRWRDSGQARSWVEAHQGHWNHADWLRLLDALKHSPFWPMDPEEVGRVLEEAKTKLARKEVVQHG